MMQVRFRGVRGSVPTPAQEFLGFGGNTTCLEIMTPNADKAVMIDCGTGARTLGRELMQRERPLEIHVLMTHFHWDHIQGLPFFAPLYDPRMDIIFYSEHPPEEMRRILAAQMEAPFFPFAFSEARARTEFRQLHAGKRSCIAGLDAWSFPLQHPQSAIGFRLEDQSGALVHAADHEHGHAETDAAVRAAAQGAAVFVMDAQYTPHEYATKVGWGHSTYSDAAEVAVRADVRRLALFHHDPLHSDDFLKQMEGDACALFPAAQMAREGDVL